MMHIIYLLMGFLLLIWGADRFVSGSSSLAVKLGVPSLIVGLTIVAFGTSAPELSVSVIAGINGSNEIALGNVMGSNIFNLLCVLGGSLLIVPITVDKALLKRDWFASIFITAGLFVFMIIDRNISILEAIILLLVFIAITTIQIIAAKKEKVITNSIQKESDDNQPKSPFFIILNIVIGLIGIILGGQLTVHGATGIALALGLSETIIGLTIVAVGTSLPELVTSIIATKKGENGIAVGNVIGSNMFNMLCILGISSLLNPITIQITALYDAIILFVITTGIFFLAKKNKLNRVWGVVFIMIYIAYTIWLIIR